MIISLIGLLIGGAFCLLTILTRSYETRNAAGVRIGMTESEASGKSTGTLKPWRFECEAAFLPPQGDLLENQLMEVSMRIEKKTLNDALRVPGKAVCQTSPLSATGQIFSVAASSSLLPWALSS